MQCGMTSRVTPFVGSSQCARPAQKARLSIVAQAGTVTVGSLREPEMQGRQGPSCVCRGPASVGKARRQRCKQCARRALAQQG